MIISLPSSTIALLFTYASSLTNPTQSYAFHSSRTNRLIRLNTQPPHRIPPSSLDPISSPLNLATKTPRPATEILRYQRTKLFTTNNPIHTIIPNGDDNNNEIDHAPCFDGICSSEPLTSTSSTTQTSTIDPTNQHETNSQPSCSSSPPTILPSTAISRLGKTPGPTVWSVFGRIASDNPSIANLGQGFPDWLPPKFALDSLVEAVMSSTQQSDDGMPQCHQYTRTAGHVTLVRELARRYSRHLGRSVDAMNEVAVTVGASQALYLSLQSLIREGDEVILFEPFFDLYVNQIKLAGGIPVYVPLTFVPYAADDDNTGIPLSGGEWKLDPTALLSKLSPKTRAIVLNSPHNPTGKIFSREEMQHIADACIRAGPQCVVLSDEVYKYIIHAPPKTTMDDDTNNNGPQSSSEQPAISAPGHTHIASLPHMWDRTITISSAGKTFSATGWQVGWAIGPSHLIDPIHRLLPYVQFCASTVVQEALARALPRAEEPYQGFRNYYEYLAAMYKKKRDLLSESLREVGFLLPDWNVTPGGGFFIFARLGSGVRAAVPPEKVGVRTEAAPGGVAGLDWALCQWMAEERGVLCIPSSPFFSKESVEMGRSDEFVRIAFCKTDETIEKAADCFSNLMGENESAESEDDDEEEEEEATAVSAVTLEDDTARVVKR